MQEASGARAVCACAGPRLRRTRRKQSADLCELGTTLGEDLVECREEVLEKVAVLARVHDLDAVAHLCDQQLSLPDSCAQTAKGGHQHKPPGGAQDVCGLLMSGLSSLRAWASKLPVMSIPDRCPASAHAGRAMAKRSTSPTGRQVRRHLLHAK
eukprot:6934755-Prymnesium_polylepis.1